MNDATERAVTAAGGLRPLAQKLGVTYQAVQKWLLTGVPPTRVLEVERITGVSKHDLRPDVFGDPDHAAA